VADGTCTTWALDTPETIAPRPGEELDAAVVAASLRPRLPHTEEALTIRQCTGGYANLTYLLRFGTHEYVLRRPPVWSKNSCSLTLVVFQQAPKPFTTLHWTLMRCAWADHREEQDIALALMIPLVMIMLDILRQRMAERRFPKEAHPREALLLDCAHPALRIGIQVGRSGRQDPTLDPGIIDEMLQCGAAFGVAVMEEILAR
jgi:hypothetical protein